MKDDEKSKNCFRLKKSKKTEQLNAMCNTGLNPIPKTFPFQGGWGEVGLRVLSQKTLLGQLIKNIFNKILYQCSFPDLSLSCGDLRD